MLYTTIDRSSLYTPLWMAENAICDKLITQVRKIGVLGKTLDSDFFAYNSSTAYESWVKTDKLDTNQRRVNHAESWALPNKY